MVVGGEDHRRRVVEAAEVVEPVDAEDLGFGKRAHDQPQRALA